jgi:hypothetical protein
LIDAIEARRTIYLPDARPFRGEAARGMPKAKLIRSSSHSISGGFAIGARASMLHVMGSTSTGSSNAVSGAAAILRERDVGEAVR